MSIKDQKRNLLKIIIPLNSYKLAGGGVMSTIIDLARFCVGISNDGLITKKGRSGYIHNGAHSGQSKSRLYLKSNKDGVPQCLVIMTNTEHSKIDLDKVRKDLQERLIAFGHWKKF